MEVLFAISLALVAGLVASRLVKPLKLPAVTGYLIAGILIGPYCLGQLDLPDGFDVIKDEDIEQMITWARKEANPLYPVPVVWSREDFRTLIAKIRK